VEDWAIQKLTGVECFFYVRLRSDAFLHRTFALALLVVSTLSSCQLLLVSGKSSVEGVVEVCQRRFEDATGKLANDQHEFWTNQHTIGKGLHHLSFAEVLPCLCLFY
jgi:hypothetical protein